MDCYIPTPEEYLDAVNENIDRAKKQGKLHLAARLKNQQIEFIHAWQHTDIYHRNRA